MKDFTNKFRLMERIYRGICLDEVEELKRTNNVEDIPYLLNKQVDFKIQKDRRLVSNSEIAAGYSLSWYRSGIVIATRFNPFKFRYEDTHIKEGHRFYIVPRTVATKVIVLDAKSLLSTQHYQKHIDIAKICPTELGHEHRKYT